MPTSDAPSVGGTPAPGRETAFTMVALSVSMVAVEQDTAVGQMAEPTTASDGHRCSHGSTETLSRIRRHEKARTRGDSDETARAPEADVLQSGRGDPMTPSAESMTLEREGAAVQARSAELRRELSIWDLAFAQILFIVGLQWVGVAAQQGPAHVIFWLIAIVLFYLPSAAVAVWLNRAMPLEGGLYQWVKLGLGESMGFIVAWNLWLFSILNMTNVGLQFTQDAGYIGGPRVAELMARNA